MICETCLSCLRAYDLTALDQEKRRTHHWHSAGLKNSVDSGCYICLQFWSTLDFSGQRMISQFAQEEDGPTPITIYRLDDGTELQSLDSLPGAYSLHIYFHQKFKTREGPNLGHRKFNAEVRLRPDQVIDWPLPRSCSTKSEETMRLAKMWIKRCTTDHEKCRILPPASPQTEQQWYPTRLLEVGSLTDDAPWCRLILPKKTPIQGPYMTLSHCWGLAHCLSLTTDNYAQLLQGIPLEDLPQLYKDALYVAAQIGIQYMWIDSLCIIQKGDELADWRQEAGLMNQVYSKSFCTVSAACARDSTESMFNNRNPDLIHPQIVQLRVAGKDVPHLVTEPKFWNMEVNRALINTRAWVFQERILSPRVLYFGKDQIFWECQQQDAAEIYPDGTSAFVVTGTPRFRGIWPEFLSHRSEDEDEELRKHVQWTNLVTEYSRNNITFAKDKLIALSAIAKTHMAWNGDQYVAGLWRKWLEWELTWSVTSPLNDLNVMAVCRCNPPPKEAEYRAPSWSWASADRSVNPAQEMSQSHDLLIEVEDVHLDYMTADTTGLVNGGWLDLWGVLKKLALRPHALKGILFWEVVVNGISIDVPVFAEIRMQIRFDDTERNFQEMENPSELYCLPTAVGRAGESDEEEIEALVLEPHDAAQGIFRRIGVAFSSEEGFSEKILTRNANEETLPCVRYENGRHLVRIV